MVDNHKTYLRPALSKTPGSNAAGNLAIFAADSSADFSRTSATIRCPAPRPKQPISASAPDKTAHRP